MPKLEPDAEDPLELRGVFLEADPGAHEEAVRCVAEEYFRLGWPEGRVLALFQMPFYAGAHQAFLALGEPRVRELVGAIGRIWSFRANSAVAVADHGTCDHQEGPCQR